MLAHDHGVDGKHMLLGALEIKLDHLNIAKAIEDKKKYQNCDCF